MKLPRVLKPTKTQSEEERLFLEASEAQFWVCRRWAAPYLPTDSQALVAISPLVLAGHMPVSGARYPNDGPNSGWIIWTGDGNEAVEDLTHEHAVHLAHGVPIYSAIWACPLAGGSTARRRARTSGSRTPRGRHHPNRAVNHTPSSKCPAGPPAG